MFHSFFVSLATFLCTTLPLAANNSTAPPEFAIVIPSYNNERWCIGNLKSCLSQNYPNFTIYYVDDCSDDKTGVLIDSYVKKHHLENKCIVIHNKSRRGALANLDMVIRTLDPKKVVVTVDGDDILAHPRVLNILASIYANPSIWLTYGSWKSEPKGFVCPCQPIPREISQANAFRSWQWVASQLRTFYAGLFQKIKPEDLLYEGKYFPTTWDLAMMFPMLEMASKSHFQYVPDIVYIYNVINPINDFRAHKELQMKLTNYIRAKAPYKPLETLFGGD